MIWIIDIDFFLELNYHKKVYLRSQIFCQTEQEKLLSELLSSRHHLARLCGYETFGHRATAESLASDPETVAKGRYIYSVRKIFAFFSTPPR